MGLLDDLKHEADSLREKQQASEAESNKNLLAAHAKLQDALRYWLDFFKALKVINPRVLRYYYVEGGGSKLEDLQQCEYNVNAHRLTVDHYDYIEAVEVRFRCAAEGSLTLEKESEPMVRRLRDHLWANNLRFDVKEARNERGYVERGMFTVKREVPVTITLAADRDNAQIRIVTRNLEKLGEYVYVYDFDEFGTDVLEELGKVIVARPHALRTLGRHQRAMTTPATRAPQAPAAQAGADDAGNAAAGSSGNLKSSLTR